MGSVFCHLLNNFIQMKRPVLTAFLALLFLAGSTQPGGHFIDYKIRSIPEKEAVSTASLGAFIKNSFDNDRDKIRAAYTWVIENIKYDTDSMYAINWNMGGSLKISESFKRRKGVCENFAGIFIDIIRKAGLTGVTIDGYTKQGSRIDKTGHTWCAVLVNDEWLLFDPTWDKDRPNDYYYFMAPSSVFAASHMPFDPIWQLTDEPVTHREFQDRGMERSDIKFNYRDSIKAFMRLGELEQLEATAGRMEKSDKISELIRNRIAYLHMQIAEVYEDRDMHLYNSAVTDLNKAMDAYNDFIQKLNDRVLTTDKAAQYKQTLAPALRLIDGALLQIAGIGKVIPNYQYDTTALKARLEEMAEKIRSQKPMADGLSKK
jgi:hypothetical protein